MDTIWLELVLIGVAIMANGFFAASEMAVVAARVGRLTRMRDDRVRGAAIALRLKQSPDTFLATIQIAITLVGTLASAIGGATAAEALTPWLAALPLPGAPVWAAPVALGVVVVVITYVSLVVGELTPKALALRHPERIACAVAGSVDRLSRLSSRLVTVLTVSTRGLLRLFGQRAVARAEVTSEEDVRHLLREGAARGVFEKVEEELVHNVFEFTDTTAREVMVPRPNILGLDVATPPEQVLARVAAIGRARIPVYRGSVDTPVGILVLKDLVSCLASGQAPVLERLMRPPLFVPETVRLSVLLRELQRTRQSLALVVDEYGAVLGLVTVEDLLEEIVGDIREERESLDVPFAVRLGDGALLVDGSAPILDVRARLGLDVPESADYHTLAGFVMHALDAVPRPGASIVLAGNRLTVVDMEGPRIVKIKVQPVTA
jgi:putative hemolysin